jgi:hypothetical protein
MLPFSDSMDMPRWSLNMKLVTQEARMLPSAVVDPAMQGASTPCWRAWFVLLGVHAGTHNRMTQSSQFRMSSSYLKDANTRMVSELLFSFFEDVVQRRGSE